MAKLLVLLIVSVPTLTILVIKFKLQRRSPIKKQLKKQPATIIPACKTYLPRGKWRDIERDNSMFATENRAFMDSLAWGQFYTMTPEEFADPKQPWNRNKCPKT